LRVLVALRPDDVESLVRYGSMAASSGDWNTGIGALGRAMQLAPCDAEITRSYLHLLVREGQSRRDPAARQAIFQEALGGCGSVGRDQFASGRPRDAAADRTGAQVPAV